TLMASSSLDVSDVPHVLIGLDGSRDYGKIVRQRLTTRREPRGRAGLGRWAHRVESPILETPDRLFLAFQKSPGCRRHPWRLEGTRHRAPMPDGRREPLTRLFRVSSLGQPSTAAYRHRSRA